MEHLFSDLVIAAITFAVLSIGLPLAWVLWRILFAPRPWGGHHRRR